MAITIANLRISPYSQKDDIQKLVFGDEWSITVKLPTPHIAGDKYSIGLDYENTLYPPNRPLCAGTEAFTLDGDELTFTLKLGTARMRDWCSKIRKPMPMAIQIVRVRNNKAETLLLDSLLALPSVYDGVVTVCEGDAIQILLDAKLDKPAVEGTAGQILSIDENGQCVWRDEQEIPEQVQADWDESDSSDPSYIQNKPTLFSGSYNDLTDKPELATVATSGSYNDLTDKPVIPEQAQADWDESDSTEASFIQNKPDLSVYSLVTETGNKLSMSIDEDYDLVVRLLDKNDNILSTQDIDLPLEAMIVNVSYASGVLTLTLQNGQTVDVDISDIVSGLVPDSRTVNGQSLSADVTITAQDLSLATVASTGDYDDLDNRPFIPANISELANDAGYQTSADVYGTVSTEIATLRANNQLVPTPQSYSVLGMTRPVQTEAKQLRWSYSFDPGACLWLEAIDNPVRIHATLVAGSSDTQTVDLWWSTNGVLWQKDTITAGQGLQLGVGLLNRYEDSGNGTFSKRIYLWKAEPNRLTKFLTLRTSNSVRVGGNLDSMTSTSMKTTGQTGPAYEFYRLLRDVKVSEFDQLVLPDRPLGDHALSQCFGASGTVGNNDQGIPLSPMIPVRSDHAATAFENFWYDPNGYAGLQVNTVRFFNRASSQVIVGGSADEGADQYGTPLPAYRNMGPSCMRGIVEMYGPSDTTIDIAHVFKPSAYYATRCVGMGEQKFVRDRGTRTSENLKSYAGYLYKLAVAAGGTLTLSLDPLTRFNTASQGYVEAIIDCDATGTVAFGTGFGSNNDAVVQGKRNHVVVRVTQGVGRLFVVDTEDIPNA